MSSNHGRLDVSVGVFLDDGTPFLGVSPTVDEVTRKI